MHIERKNNVLEYYSLDFLWQKLLDRTQGKQCFNVLAYDIVFIVDVVDTGLEELQRTKQFAATAEDRNIKTVGRGTIHHTGQSSPFGEQSSRPNLPQQHIETMSNQTKNTSSVLGASGSVSAPSNRTSGETKPPALNLTFPNLTALANQSGPSPKKKVKLEEKPAPTQEIANHRKLILDLKYRSMLDIKEPYIDNLTEMFFLQNGLNLMDFHSWKKRPTPQLVHFLKSGSLDSDDEEESSLERKINNEVKIIQDKGKCICIIYPAPGILHLMFYFFSR